MLQIVAREAAAAACGVDRVLAALFLHLSAPSDCGTVRFLAHAARQHPESTFSLASESHAASNMPLPVAWNSSSSTSSSSSSCSSQSRPSSSHGQSSASLAACIDQQQEPWPRAEHLTAGDVQHQQMPSWHIMDDPQPATYLANLASLSLHPAELALQNMSALRRVLSSMPPSKLHNLLEQQQELQQLLRQHQQQRHPKQQHTDALLHLQDLLVSARGTLRALRRHVGHAQPTSASHLPHEQQQGTLQHLGRLRVMSPAAHSCHSHFQQVAEAVVEALGLPADHSPVDDASILLLLQKRAARPRLDSSNATSSSGGSSSSAQRGYASMATPSLTLAAGLVSALETSSRASHLRLKPLHTAAGAAELAQQLHRTVCMDLPHVLKLLLSHPTVLWQHKTPNMPTQLMSGLQQLLPGLLEDSRLPQLLRKQHRLLSCSTADLQALVDLLSTRLQASQDQAVQMVMQHPALLVTPVKQMLPNVGFLVGLGLTPSDLRVMAVRNPKWLTVSLRGLTSQWQFVQQLLKSYSRQDLVLFPQLLTLPIGSCLGPRVLYARKRNIKLLAPSVAALVARSGERGAVEEWRESKMVPLEYWLTATEKQLCAAMGLQLDDFKRFKHAYGKVEYSH